jgi:superfamily I DNA/RNA helicase
MSDILQKLKGSSKALLVGLAGPGTGKSTAFKTIIESEDYKGKKILILTFINKLVDDLTKDFEDYRNVKVLTLHAFAKQKLGEMDLDEGLDLVISEDHFFITGEAIDYRDKFYENDLTVEEEVFYKGRRKFYQHEKELYSLSSVIYAINRALGERPDNIPIFDLILIDEFQDFNKSEYELIRLLNTKNRVIVVGDDNQSLYHWKKAKPDLIIDLYKDDSTEEFSLDYCYRCTEVIVDSVNDLIGNTKKAGYLRDRLEKKFLYPKDNEEKNKISQKYPYIDFIPAVQGNLLIYKLEQNIKSVADGKKRILILVPSFLKQSIYEGLTEKGFNVVGFELFSDEKKNDVKHKDLINIFEVLLRRKTDNLALRKILFLYLTSNQIRDIIVLANKENKNIWNYLDNPTKRNIEGDISIFKKVKSGKDNLLNTELTRFAEIFNVKNVLSKMIRGFTSIQRKAIEVEITTVMSSKGLSAEFVYYVGIDDRTMADKETKSFSDHTFCEFLVGITRAKEKLTLISLTDTNPKILEFIDSIRINTLDGG